MNTYTEYEYFTQEIIQQLAQATQVKEASVQHNVKLEGLSGQKHQIDVYWEYEKDGKTHKVAIECKNYKRRISLEKVCAFKGVLDDLDGVSGIMVSKVGFQKGAKRFAQQYHISLKELRQPKYGETIIGEIEDHIHTEIRYIVYRIDEDWAAKNDLDIQRCRERLSLIFMNRPEFWNDPPYISLNTKDNIIRDASGKKITTLRELEKTLPPHRTDAFPIIFKYDDAYVETPSFGPIKILEIKYDYNVKDQHQTIVLDAGYLVRAILKDAQNDETDFVALY